jgi:nucleotide sugar dehydrogenase
MKEKIIVISAGYVGSAVINLLKNHFEIYCYDPAYHPGIKYANHNDVIFLENIQDHPEDTILGVVCTPTPSNSDGSCDISLVEDTVQKLKTPLILLKSTVEIGTTEALIKKTNKRIVFSPEFVGESKYYNPYFNNNMLETPWVVLGGASEDTKKVLEILIKVLGPTKKYYQCSSKEAEMIKYITNVFFATKVTFCNEIYGICEKAGIDYWKVREGWLLDPRVGGDGMHTAVFPGDRGFGGRCFPKDTSALAKYAEKIGYEANLIKEVIKSNERFRNPQKEEEKEKNGYDKYLEEKKKLIGE